MTSDLRAKRNNSDGVLYEIGLLLLLYGDTIELFVCLIFVCVLTLYTTYIPRQRKIHYTNTMKIQFENGVFYVYFVVVSLMSPFFCIFQAPITTHSEKWSLITYYIDSLIPGERN